MAQKPSFYKKHKTFFNNRNSVYNGQDILKNHFLHSHPVVYTDDTSDLTQAHHYKDKSSHAWLVSNEIESLRTFPWWFKVSQDHKSTIFRFPCMYKDSWKIYSWNSVQLVPTVEYPDLKISKQRQIAGEYDVFQGKDSFDKFYLGKELPDNLKDKEVTCVSSIKEAQEKSKTAMCWIVPSHVNVKDTFKFDFKPDNWSFNYCHVFKNENFYDGVILIPKKYNISKNEEDFWFFIAKKEIDIVASTPRSYDIFYINTYEEYLEAAAESKTRMFWAVTDSADTKDFDFEYQVPRYDKHLTNITHVFKNGLYLFSVDNLVTKNEFEHKHFLQRQEVD